MNKYENLNENEELEFMEAEAKFLNHRIEAKKASIAESQAKLQENADSEMNDLQAEDASYGERQ